ncbi:MAG: protein kinase [Anaerolineae bacterium]|nr:protein kinase [Anaerolineae bacterium]
MVEKEQGVIKGYELRDRIGAGGFGAVYRSYQSTVRREVAIKVILPHYASQPEFIRRFETEAQIIARLEHPFIVPLYDYWRDPNGAYLIMRYFRGGNLRDMLRKGPLDLEQAMQFLNQIGSALAVAHRNGVIHRDIKPANILMDEDGNFYLSDFGIAKDLAKSGGTITDPNALIGSPDYLAPEQARNELVTPQTDIYSLGIVLYEVLTGQHPYPDMTPVERLFKHLEEPVPSILTLDNDIAEAVNAVIQTATDKNPSHRFDSIMTMVNAFCEAAMLGVSRGEPGLVELLTSREQGVLRLIIDGRSNREIAEALTIEITTVKWYVTQIYRKLNVRSRVQAIVRARELNLVVGRDIDSGAGTSSSSMLPEPDNPYKGLLAFQPADEQDFFGRESLTGRLVKRLGENNDPLSRFLAVVGPSGSGKSSLVKAGLIPAVWRGELANSDRWFVVEMTPGTHPMDELEVALMRIAPKRLDHLREQLERDERGLLRAAQLILPDDGSDLLLVVDQFEEVFTLVEDETQCVHFLNLLRTAVTSSRSRVRVVMTLRADFYDRPLQYPEFGELVRSRMETVLPMSVEELDRAIRCPAERVGVRFEEGLVARIIDDVHYQPGALPLLQYALTELFENRDNRTLTQAAYLNLGGTVGALAKRAEEIYGELSDDGRETVLQMFLRLVTPREGAEYTRRRVNRAELLSAGADRDLMDEVIDTFTAYRLLSTDRDPASRRPTVEIAHEAILREWERLRTWLDESREDLRMQRQLARAASDWLGADRDESFLLRGGRLRQFEVWAAGTELALTSDESAFLEQSIAERAREEAEEQARQEREARLERHSVARLRALVAVLLAATLVAAGLTVYAFGQRQSAQDERDNADLRADEANSLTLLSEARVALAEGNPNLALALVLEANRIESAPVQVLEFLYHVAYLPSARRRLVGHEGWVMSVAFSPDSHLAVSGSSDGALFLWNLNTGEIVRQFEGHDGRVSGVVFSANGQRVLSSSNDGTLALWDVDTGAQIRRFEGHSAAVNAVAISPDGRYALSASSDNTIILWDIDTGAVVRQMEGHSDVVNDVAFAPDGQTALSASADATLILWDIPTGESLRVFSGHDASVQAADISPDGQTALSGDANGSMLLWELSTGEILRHYAPTDSIHDVAFSPDGQQAVTGTGKADPRVIVWDVATGAQLQNYSVHTDAVRSVAFNNDGSQIISASADATLILWDLVPFDPEGRQYVGHSGLINGIAFSPDGQRAVSGADDRSVILWNVGTGELIRRFDGFEGEVRSVAFSPDGRTIAASDTLGVIVLLDSQSGSELWRLLGHEPISIDAVVFSPDGQMLLSGGADKNLILWNAATGEEIRRFEGHTAFVKDVAFSPDGRLAASGGADLAILWDVKTGRPIRTIEGHEGNVEAVRFSPDGQYLFTISNDNTQALWDVETGEMIYRTTIPGGAARGGDFTPDGRLSLSGLADLTVVLQHPESGVLLHRFFADYPNESDIAISPDGEFALIQSMDSSIHLWQIGLAWVPENRYLPEFTCEERIEYRIDPLCDPESTE